MCDYTYPEIQCVLSHLQYLNLIQQALQTATLGLNKSPPTHSENIAKNADVIRWCDAVGLGLIN